ncbi:MAG: alpha/beta fold hydrolase, partial [Akkermansiaceae bacterium]
IFIHGLGGGAERTVSAFSKLKDHQVIAPDMPGHGDSKDYSVSELGFDRFADHVIELMDDLGIESCNIGGLSMGSGITLNLALRYPERIKKIIILRPSWLHQEKPEHLRLVACVGQWIEEFGVIEAREKLLTDPDFLSLDKENKPVANSIGILFGRPTTAASIAVLYKMWQDAPFADPAQLSTLANPALVLTTTRDELHPQSTADVIAAHLPDVRTAELPPRYHEPEAYALALSAIVQKFLAE